MGTPGSRAIHPTSIFSSCECDCDEASVSRALSVGLRACVDVVRVMRKVKLGWARAAEGGDLRGGEVLLS
jgi:hypothetical protein